MTFLDIINLTKKRINFTDTDDTIDSIVKSAINFAYFALYTQVQKKPVKVALTKLENSDSYIKIYSLPTNFYSEVVTLGDGKEIDPSEYEIKGGLLITRGSNAAAYTAVNMYYINTPTALSGDTDTVQLNDMYCTALSIYGAYMYYTHKKKIDIASLLANEFNALLKNENARIKKESGTLEIK